MKTEAPEDAGLTLREQEALQIIRTETALSRFPVHRLAKKGNVQIEIRNQASALLWEVTYNSKYGQPGPLAYKLDTLIVNHRVQQERARDGAVPRLLRLGSLTEILHELGRTDGGDNITSVRKALLQNAFAAINAKIRYQTRDRVEKWAEFADTRYGVIFTGEKLPDGTTADAVYLNLHDTYRAILDEAMTRPLDFEYMKTLPPAAQRFYEIASYQVYAALLHQNERAKLRYSEYCMLSTATRYLDFDHVKKQMYKTHRPHLESGYLAKVGYEPTTDAAGEPDWFMYYVPGPNASREYREFTGGVKRRGRGGVRASQDDPKELPVRESLFLPFPEFEQAPAPQEVPTETTPVAVPEALVDSGLVEALAAAGLNRASAERFARERPDECRRQLAYLPYVTEFKSSRGAYLRSAIEQGFAPPAAYEKQQAAAETQRRKQEETERRKAAEAAQKAAEVSLASRTDDDMARLESEAPSAFSGFLAYLAEQRRQAATRFSGMSPSIREKALRPWDRLEKRREMFREWQQLSPTERDGYTSARTDLEDTPTALADEDTADIRSLIESALGEKSES